MFSFFVCICVIMYSSLYYHACVFLNVHMKHVHCTMYNVNMYNVNMYNVNMYNVNMYTSYHIRRMYIYVLFYIYIQLYFIIYLIQVNNQKDKQVSMTHSGSIYYIYIVYKGRIHANIHVSILIYNDHSYWCYLYTVYCIYYIYYIYTIILLYIVYY